MSSKRHLRRRSCESKVKHEDEVSARKHAHYLTRRNGIQYMPYRCKFCTGWHAGRPDRRKWQGINSRRH